MEIIPQFLGQLYLDNVTAEAIHAEKQVIEQVAYDEAKALALLDLQTAVLASATCRSRTGPRCWAASA